MKQFDIVPYLPHLISMDDRKESGWIKGVILGRFFAAKVYDEPSIFGIDHGRVSKLAIGKESMRNREKNYHEQLDYQYDRGIVIDQLDGKIINRIVGWLEKLPKVLS